MWSALPPDALRTVFGCLPDAHSRRSCRLVCRSWLQAAGESPEIWQNVQRRWPRPGTAAASAAAVEQPTAEQLAALLHRQRAHLRRLQLEQGAWSVGDSTDPAETLARVLAAACSEGSGLTDITLALSGELPDAVMRALPGAAQQLTSLTLKPLRKELALRWAQLGAGLSQLAKLTLTASLDRAGPRAGPPDALSTLDGLTMLRLRGLAAHATLPELGEQGVLLAVPPTLLRLDLLSLDLRQAEPLVVAVHPPAPGVPEAIGAAIEAGAAAAEALAQQLSDGSGSGSSEDEGGSDEDAASSSSGGSHLSFLPELDDIIDPLFEAEYEAASEAARQRAAAPLAARWQRLEHLRLHDCHVGWTLLRALPQLPCLTALHLATNDGQNWEGQALSTVQQCSHLQELVLGRLSGEHIGPRHPHALQQLTRLRFSGCKQLRSLHPSWCTLPSLLSFELESCERLGRLPPEFAALDRLERLSFSHQRMEHLPEVVTGLSQLTRLAVVACSLRELPAGPYLRSLRELVLFANNLHRVPPALAHPQWGAAGLRQLDLSSNYSHFLSEDDVAVLAPLTCLMYLTLARQLYSDNDAHPAAALAALHAALPRCEVVA